MLAPGRRRAQTPSPSSGTPPGADTNPRKSLNCTEPQRLVAPVKASAQGGFMPEFLTRNIYQLAADEVCKTPPPRMEELFSSGVVQYRVGKIISDAVYKSEHHTEQLTAE